MKLFCDNMGVVQAVNSQTANSPRGLHCCDILFLKCLVLNVHAIAERVAGVDNGMADYCSGLDFGNWRRRQMRSEFHALDTSGVWDSHRWLWSADRSARVLGQPTAGVGLNGKNCLWFWVWNLVNLKSGCFIL